MNLTNHQGARRRPPERRAHGDAAPPIGLCAAAGKRRDEQEAGGSGLRDRVSVSVLRAAPSTGPHGNDKSVAEKHMQQRSYKNKSYYGENAVIKGRAKDLGGTKDQTVSAQGMGKTCGRLGSA